MERKNTVISVQMLNEAVREFEINSAAPLVNILPKLIEAVVPAGQQMPKMEDLKFLIARQLTLPELTMNESLQATGLQIENGDFLLLIVPSALSTGTSLQILDAGTGLPIHAFDKDIVMVGRQDPDVNINPDLDLTGLLPIENLKSISRRLLWFERKDEKWFVRLHPDARTTVYLENQVLDKNQQYLVQDGTTLGFGGQSSTSPIIRIICRLETTLEY